MGLEADLSNQVLQLLLDRPCLNRLSQVTFIHSALLVKHLQVTEG